MENDWPPNREVGFIIHNLKTASGNKYTSFTFQFTPCQLCRPLIGALRTFSPNETRADAVPGRACTRVKSDLCCHPDDAAKFRNFAILLRSVTSGRARYTECNELGPKPSRPKSVNRKYFDTIDISLTPDCWTHV